MFSYLTQASVILTLKLTCICLILQLFVGLPLGLLLSGKKNVFTNILDIAITLPMIFPPMAMGFFLLVVLGKNGIIGKFMMTVFQQKIIFTFWAVLIAVFTVGLPFMVKSVQSARQQMDKSIVEAASTLGKSSFVILFRLILPNIKNGIVTGMLLSFGRSLGEVGISLMLGGNIIGRTETLSLAIYNAVFEGDFETAAKLSFILSVIAVIVLVGLNLTNTKLNND